VGDWRDDTMQDMGSKRGRPPEGSGAAIRSATERPARPTRREYTPEYKERILRELEELRVAGEKGALGALLRREGLVWPTVHRWRESVAKAGVKALVPNKRGRKPTRDPVREENERLRRQNERLQTELRKAEIIIDVQKKLAALLGVEVPAVPEPEKDGKP
jgi:transposase